MSKAFAVMTGLCFGAKANPGEHRMIGSYWLGSAGTVPIPEIGEAIDGIMATAKWFAPQVRYGTIHSAGRVLRQQLCGISLLAYGNDTEIHYLAFLTCIVPLKPYSNYIPQVVMELLGRESYDPNR